MSACINTLHCNAGVDEVDTPQHDADVGAEHDPVGAGKTDAATYEAREHSPAQAPAAQPLERPHGMLGGLADPIVCSNIIAHVSAMASTAAWYMSPSVT